MKWLKIDIDRVDGRSRVRRILRVGMLLATARERCQFEIYVKLACVHRSVHGLHVRVYISDVSRAEVVALQAICGSDPIREILNLARVREGWPHPNVLFSEREKWAKGQRSKDVGREVYDAELTEVLRRRLRR